ncbi:MAG: cyclic nucleotide-binding domain-containing protein [Desulfobacterales bacterium]|nr:cyclic nucleotide-binding domain-containing protein [Desulfobacterales bacterium]
MIGSEAIFKIIEEDKCPLYQLGDEFRLSDRALSLPEDKQACIILVLDITELLLNRCNSEGFCNENGSGFIFNCTGPGTNCPGVIRLRYKKDDSKNGDGISTITGLLSGFSIFQSLNDHNIKELVSFLKHKHFGRDDIIINKGDPGVKLFIIISGKVEVLGEDGVRIAFLEKGDVFGEMSLLSGDPVGATIKVAEPARVLYIDGRDFRRVLNRFPALQMYFARLLARRLAETNALMSEELSSGITGKLSEIPPAELLQTLNMNNKTGVLSLQLSKGTADISFKEGAPVRAGYDGKKDREAFFEVLKEKEGRFKFTPGLSDGQAELGELGDFMWLLMEGLNRIDEKSG